MMIIFFLIGASLLLAGGFLIAFIYSTKKGQFDDTYTPSVRMLFDNKIDEEEIKEKDKGK